VKQEKNKDRKEEISFWFVVEKLEFLASPNYNFLTFALPKSPFLN